MVLKTTIPTFVRLRMAPYTTISKQYTVLLCVLIVFALCSILNYYGHLSRSITIVDSFNNIRDSLTQAIRSEGLQVDYYHHLERELRVDFPGEGFELIQVAAANRIKMFIIEPCILWRALIFENQDLLRQKKWVKPNMITCEDSGVGLSVMSFGMTSADELTKEFFDTLKERKFQLEKAFIDDNPNSKVIHFVAKKRR